MDRQGISSPVYDNNDGVNNYISKASIFDLEWQMQGAQSRLRERIENISIDIRHSEARKRDYIDKKLSAHKEEQDARMEEIRALIKSSSTSSSTRRRCSSHKSSEHEKDASANCHRPHLHGDHHHVRHQHRHEGQVTSKHHVHDDDERHLLRAQVRQRRHNMKMLHKHKCTSPNKPYFTPSRSFISTREDRETSTTKTVLRLHQPLWHLRQVLSRHLRLWTYGIFAYLPRVRLLWLF